MARPDSKYTKLKVISGYTLLFLLSILFTVLIYKQITKLIIEDNTINNADEKLFLIGNIITGLYEAEAHGNAFIQTGSRTYFRNYLNILKTTESNIDSLKILTIRPEQQLRIDTIQFLLEEKVRNMQDLVNVKRSLAPDEFYNKAIASIESGKDSLPEQVNIRTRLITTLDSSYVKTEKKRRGLFSRAKPDSVLQVSVQQHMVIDTLESPQDLQSTDTIVNILKSTWEDMQKQTQDIKQQINRKEYALIRQSTYITDQLKRILGEYEKEEIYNTLTKQQSREQVITTVIHIFAWVAVVAFLLVIFFTFFILRDLAQSQRYRRELESANQLAENLLKSREKMILTVTHDIKSPLSSVIGYIDLLNHTPVNERQRYYLKNMQGSSEHILQLVGNLLDLSKLENNKMPVENIIFNPSQLFREITDTFIPLAGAKKLEIRAHISEDLNHDYKGDALRIRQIITNILSNAIKYTQQGGVEFTAHPSGNRKQVLLQIKDSGSGMTPEEQTLIFKEFTRLSSHAAIEGTGIGLTITLKLIHLLGGEIKLDSQQGKGSCFTIILPLEKTQEKTAIPVKEQLSPRALPSPSALKILLVDDDPLQLEMASALLENNGLHPTTTTAPEEVKDLLLSGDFNMVISDIQMPGMSGFELIRQIRQLPQPFAHTLPVIALSADSDKKEEDYIQAGFTAYLPKPFSAGQLISLIQQLSGETCQGRKAKAINKQEVLSEKPQGLNPGKIMAFTDGDQETARKIIASFLSETRKHLSLLEEYLQAGQYDSLAKLAHKMLPMFRQFELNDITPLLEKVEHSGKTNLSPDSINELLQAIIKKTKTIIENQ